VSKELIELANIAESTVKAYDAVLNAQQTGDPEKIKEARSNLTSWMTDLELKARKAKR
jgi:hypothetical protein